MLLALLALHAVIAAAAPLAAPRLGRRVFPLCALAPVATVAYAAWQAPSVLAGEPVRQRVTWVGDLGLYADFLLDPFALVMVALVSGIGTLIFLYSGAYFSPRPDLGRFASRLTAFAGAMLGLVLTDNLLLIYVFWELTSITSYLLIGFEDRRGSARAAALQAIIITGAGGLAMLAGLVLIGQAAGTYTLSEVLASPPTGAVATAGALLTLAGAFTKSAQVPFHSWLPGAMAAPTPVSAYLHSATMVKAGVYLVARLAPAFAVVAGWRPLLLTVGVATMLVGGYRALRQHDLKLLLAYGTVSQLGFMMTLFGVGLPEATTAGVALILAHGLFKAALFMVVGIIDHQAHTRDLRRLSGLGRRMPATAAVAVVAAASMAGIPPLFGFVAKEAAYETWLHGDLGLTGPLVLAGLVVGSILTFAYSFRFVHGAFATKPGPSHDHVGAGVPTPAPSFVGPTVVLAGLTVAFGVVPDTLSGLVFGAAQALDPAVEAGHLALWHGLNTALLLSVLTIAAGATLVAYRTGVEALQGGRLADRPGAQEAYVGGIKGLNIVSDRVTGIVQNGSLPTYLAVILLTMVLLPASALWSGASLTMPQRFAESPLQVAVVVGIAFAAFGTIYARRRFSAVLFLGGVGYGVATLFVLQGAPDLALTQFLIETLSVVIFALVLRHLPDTVEPRRWAFGQNLRRLVAASVGLFVFGFALIAGAARTARPVADAYLARSLPEAGGRNIVNVILVDFRGFDTFGEITVLTVAGLGIASLVLAKRPKADAAGEEADAQAPEAVLSAGGRTAEPGDGSAGVDGSGGGSAGAAGAAGGSAGVDEPGAAVRTRG